MVTELERYVGESLQDRARIAIPCPFHNETQPSLYINIDGRSRKHPVGSYYCLGADTRVITSKGVKRIADMSGSTHKVLTTGGQWVRVPFKDYGTQRLYRIDLSRNGVKKTIYATKEHRWFLKEDNRSGRRSELQTHELRERHILASVRSAPQPLPKPMYSAIRHGFIVGDGTLDGPFAAKAYMYGSKIDFMSKYFDSCTKQRGHKTYEYDYHDLPDDRYQGRLRIVTGFAPEYKALPSLSSSRRYIFSFLAGLIAADGCVDKAGTTSLHSADRNFLLRVRDLCTKVGITTLSLTHQLRKGYGECDTPLYRIHFLRSSFPASMLLNPEHRRRFTANPPKLDYVCWKVDRVRRTNREETVYCCEVPETHAFVLEDNILTGNCFGCRAKTSTHGGWNGLASLLGLAQIDGNQSQITTFVAPSRTRLVPHFDAVEGFDWQNLLETWNIEFAIPWPRDQSFRGVPGWLMRRTGAYLAFDGERQTSYAILLQHTNHVLVGAVKAVLRPTRRTRAKYLNARGPWVKTHGLWPWQTVEQMVSVQRQRGIGVAVALVEGPRDALRLIGCGVPALAILGSNNWTVEKRDLFVTLDPDVVLFGFDNDSGGKLAYDLVSPTVVGYSRVEQLDYRWAERDHRRQHKQSGDKTPWVRPKLDPGSVDVHQIKLWRTEYGIRTVSLRDKVFDSFEPYPLETTAYQDQLGP